MEKWMVAAKRADFSKIADTFGIDPVTARLIRNRDIIGDEEIRIYLQGDRRSIPSPWLLKGMEELVSILIRKIKEKKKIRILGDYDIDGVMSTFILLQGLKRLGAVVDTVIPHRIIDGYGINEHLVEQAWEDGIDTILTCDNGISAVNQIARAKELGMTVLVTDHHEVPFVENEEGRVQILPEADAIVDPKQETCSYPFSHICGAVVALKVMEALYERERPDVDFVDEMLEFAAIATIGDVMDLKKENRIYVKEGLMRLHQTQNLGLQELIRVNGLEPEQIKPYHIGFVIGPCLNASGRLDTASRALELLGSTDRAQAAKLAGDLKALNDSRKEMTDQGVEAAIHQVEETERKNDPVLVLYLPDCHESLAGIIAGRMRERYHRPAIVLTKAEQGLKGSGRSIEAYSMFEKLSECGEYLEKFGGHPMAAGLSLKEENLEAFREKLNRCCGLTQEDLIEKVLIDVPMPISYINSHLIEELTVLEPFGKGNEKPVFAQSGLKISGIRVFGKKRNVVKMRLTDAKGFSIDGVYFGDGEELERKLQEKDQVSVIYYPEIDTYMGRNTIQIVVRSIQ